jgi:K+-sensing histidine kinase KdpD
MVELQVDGGDLLVRLSPLEKLGALRGDATVRTRPGSLRETQLLDGYAQLARQLRGAFVTLDGPSVARALSGDARRHLVTEMLVARGRPHRRWRRGTLRELVHLVPDVDIHLLSAR